MGFLKTIGNFITKMNEFAAKAVMWLIFPLSFIVVYEVFMRYILNKPAIYTFDLTWMIYGALIFIGGGYALQHEVHVRADIFYNMMKRRGKLIVNLFCYPVFFFASVIALVYSSYFLMANAWIYGEISRGTSWGPPTGPIKTVLFVSMVLLLLQGIVKFAEVIKGDKDKEMDKAKAEAKAKGGEAA